MPDKRVKLKNVRYEIMAKKVKKIEQIEVKISGVEVGQQLEQKFAEYKNVSLRKLADACEISYQWLLKVSKKAREGEVYSSEAINWEEVGKLLVKKEVNIETLPWETMNEVSKRGRESKLVKDVEQFQVGMKVWIRGDFERPWEIVYRNDGYVVVQREGEEKVSAWSWETFLFKGASFERREQKEVK